MLAGKNLSFTLTTYDGLNAAGNKLSTTTLTGQTVVAGQANTFPVTLSGVVAGITLTLGQPTPPIGTSATIPLTVAALDADGYTILDAANSPYVDASGKPLTITLADSDTSGATALSTSTVTNSGASVSVLYSGAAIGSAIFSATAPGISASKITNATLIPSGGVSSGGAVAIAVVTVGTTTYAFVPAVNGLAQVTVALSGVIQSSVSGGKQPQGFPMPPAGLDQQQLEAWWDSYLAKEAAIKRAPAATGTSVPSASPSATPSPIPISPAPNECAANTTSTGATLYCINYLDTQGRIDVVNVSNTGASSLTTQFKTDASGLTSYSGGSCVVCGVVFDATDNAIIISSKNGYELYGLTPPYSHIKTIAANASENFGYDVATDQVWSPQYSGTPATLDLVDIPSSKLYTFFAPDSGAVVNGAGDLDSRPRCRSRRPDDRHRRRPGGIRTLRLQFVDRSKHRRFPAVFDVAPQRPARRPGARS